jgi:hypothetical protein
MAQEEGIPPAAAELAVGTLVTWIKAGTPDAKTARGTLINEAKVPSGAVGRVLNHAAVAGKECCGVSFRNAGVLGLEAADLRISEHNAAEKKIGALERRIQELRAGLPRDLPEKPAYIGTEGPMQRDDLAAQAQVLSHINEIEAVWDMVDTHKSGTLDAKQMKSILIKMDHPIAQQLLTGHPIGDFEFGGLMQSIDKNGSGTVDKHEFLEWWGMLVGNARPLHKQSVPCLCRTEFDARLSLGVYVTCTYIYMYACSHPATKISCRAIFSPKRPPPLPPKRPPPPKCLLGRKQTHRHHRHQHRRHRRHRQAPPPQTSRAA